MKESIAKLLYRISVIIITFAIILMLYFLYLLHVPCKIVTFHTPTYEIVTPNVKAGGIVQFKVSLTKHKSLPATRSAQVIDGFVYNVADRIVNIPAQECKFISSQKLPTYIAPGRYYIRINYKFRVNKLRDITYTINTDYFNVVK